MLKMSHTIIINTKQTFYTTLACFLKIIYIKITIMYRYVYVSTYM